ncbi:Type I restriction modification DNA specificity domain protein OS=Burkholderia pseudomallei MSHR332 GN=Y030_4190 PE=4 SV=1 [Gemmata massiliana]|uniref:Type I restriction modification DNA specificity domain protein n=1 Tax=Gemmata massiliana TaxID=1210884 RepID=A0A6P2DKV9_9BACT|nr:hypothetical protein [Gemmata massiliana]VTS01308.1 Type I restriction modification DNA specificity domain protein OS=Burkholderia pseudomallei MSHR332 GN=Y030_4190 PE=4 SV=1 [Gemmata massiliana]
MPRPKTTTTTNATPTKSALPKGREWVRFGDVVQNVNVTCANPKEAGLERYVGLEHLEPRDLRIRSWGSIANETTFNRVFRSGQVLAAHTKKEWLAMVLQTVSMVRSPSWASLRRPTCCATCSGRSTNTAGAADNISLSPEMQQAFRSAVKKVLLDVMCPVLYREPKLTVQQLKAHFR